MGAIAPIIGAVVSLAGGLLGGKPSIPAPDYSSLDRIEERRAEEERKARELEQKQQVEQARRERLAELERQRVQRAQLVARGEALGASGSSSVVSGSTALARDSLTSLQFQDQQLGIEKQKQERLNNAAALQTQFNKETRRIQADRASAISSANSGGGIGSIVGGIGKVFGSFFG